MPRPSKGYYIQGEQRKKRIPGVTTPIGIIWETYKSDNMLDWAVLEEYGRQDVASTFDLAYAQSELLEVNIEEWR